MKMRSTLPVASLVLVIGILPGFGQGAVTRIAALKGPSGIALIQLFERPPVIEGGAAELVAVPSADLMAAKLVSGEYQFATLPVNVAAKLRSAGLPIVLDAVIGNGMLSLLTNDPSINALADLKGSQLDVAGQGATPDYLMRRLLKEAGLDPDRDLKLAYALSYPDMAAALASGAIKSAVLPEPFATQARMANPGLRMPVDLAALWRRATGMADYPMTVLVHRSDAGLSQGSLRLILAACRDSVGATMANPAAASLLVKKYELLPSAAVAQAAIPRCNFVWLTGREARASIEALLAEFLRSSPASIGGSLPTDAFYSSAAP